MAKIEDSNDEKMEMVDDIRYMYSTNWIYNLESIDHWKLYWYQQGLIQKYIVPNTSILEIGPGSGFTSNYLISKGYRVTTLDIDSGKNPDIVANVVQYDFPHEYDNILAFEVFEHIPYQEFLKVLERLRDKGKWLYFSVPAYDKEILNISVKLPLLRKIALKLRIKKTRITEDHHFWEVGFQDFSIQKLNDDISQKGFEVKETTRYSGRYFFALESMQH